MDSETSIRASSPTRTIKLVLEYDGTAYAGWQIQPHAQTVQGVLKRVVETVMNHPATIYGASRTDAGVHARFQVAAFRTPSLRPVSVIMKGLNAMLPSDIRIRRAEEAPARFHPRADAISKTYRYALFTGRKIPVFQRLYVAPVRGKINLEEMEKAAEYFVGTHDFSSFRASHCSARTTIREISESRFNKLQNDHLEYIISGNRFLHNMVRIIVGTLIWIGKGKMKVEELPALFEKKDRRYAGPTAPAKGLFLENIRFKED
ncbi:MAG: tRNA pseudouridine(38-40) synthase TruA [Acidobacteria bacterium]|nr:MAG: tRNA pseudouridine(38-40) synthase TruA [Acidobacteriota bacterium]RLE21630.1 MAG: tRNA pseudouridine(38-40) synthase TruA [Acidobacteriota bacterium]